MARDVFFKDEEAYICNCTTVYKLCLLTHYWRTRTEVAMATAHVRGYWGSAGWGAWICSKNKSAIADLWGLVVTDPKDEFYCGCMHWRNE